MPVNILALISGKTGQDYPKASSRERKGPCPWCGGEDRFRIWPEQGRYWCRQCGRSGDAIQFLRDFAGLSFQEAAAEVGKRIKDATFNHNNNNRHNSHKHHKGYKGPPPSTWSEAAWPFIYDCQAHLLEKYTNPKALQWLQSRGLREGTLWSAGLGYNPQDRYLSRSSWGLPLEINKGRPKKLWLPRGITIPWVVDGELWGVRIRRPMGEPKYYWVPGGTSNGLYNADAIVPGNPVVLVEGELDALTIQQQASDLTAAVATGSTHGARHVRWLARLSTASIVLVAYDADEAGDKASIYWRSSLDNAVRWRPWWSDVNQLHQENVDIRRWINLALHRKGMRR